MKDFELKFDDGSVLNFEFENYKQALDFSLEYESQAQTICTTISEVTNEKN